MMVTDDLRMQILRSIIICSVVFLTYVGYRSVPLGVASAISSSEPVFVAIWALILGQETFKSMKLLLPIVVLGIAGVSLVSNASLSSFMTVNSDNTLGLIALILANILCSGGHYLSSILGKSNKSATTLAYNLLFCNGFMLVTNIGLGVGGYGFDFNLLRPYTLYLVALGGFAALLSWLGLEALRNIDPNTHVGIQNLSLPFAILISYLIEGEKISLVQMVGIAAIFLSTWLLSYRKLNTAQDEVNKLKRYTIMSYIGIAILAGVTLIAARKAPNTTHKHHDHCCC